MDTLTSRSKKEDGSKKEKETHTNGKEDSHNDDALQMAADKEHTHHTLTTKSHSRTFSSRQDKNG